MVDFLVRATLKSADGLAKNDCVNTFSCMDITGSPATGEIMDLFGDFYITVAPGATNAIGEYVNQSIQRTNGLLIELVEDPATPPNSPDYAATYTLPAALSGGSLPQECAVVSTQYAAFGDPLTPGRNRSRQYIGPLVSTISGTSDGIARPLPLIIDDLAAAASQLRTEVQLGSEPVTRAWTVWSRADAAFKVIGGGWVDDEFDTQRRRGRLRTGRNLWN